MIRAEVVPRKGQGDGLRIGPSVSCIAVTPAGQSVQQHQSHLQTRKEGWNGISARWLKTGSSKHKAYPFRMTAEGMLGPSASVRPQPLTPDTSTNRVNKTPGQLHLLRLTDFSPAAEHSMLQSGEMEQQYTHCMWPDSTWTCLPGDSKHVSHERWAQTRARAFGKSRVYLHLSSFQLAFPPSSQEGQRVPQGSSDLIMFEGNPSNAPGIFSVSSKYLLGGCPPHWGL